MDQRIINQISQRDEQGVQLLLEKYGGLLKTIITKHLYSLQAQVNECMNDTLLAIWNNIDKYDETKSSFKNWIAVIAKYQAIDFLRKHRHLLKQDVISEHESYQDQRLELWELEWHDLIKDLSVEDQNLLTMIYRDGYKPNEVAVITGMRTSNIYNRLSRSKKKIQNRYGGERL